MRERRDEFFTKQPLLCSCRKRRRLLFNEAFSSRSRTGVADHAAFVHRELHPAIAAELGIGSGGLLLGETVKGTEAPDQVYGMYPHNRPIREEFRQDAQCTTVIRIVKRGDNDLRIGDIEIRITRRYPLVIKVQRGWHREGNDIQCGTVFQARTLQAFEVFQADTMVRIRRVRFPAP